jgi:hypothetical protein
VVNDDGREENDDPGEGDKGVGYLGLAEIDVSFPKPIVATDAAVTAPGTRFSSSP